MKTLRKLLLINWHYFTHELIEFEQLNFMTGDNATGKSTIIDALQLVLFGETAGKYFNKSVSGKSNRTLSSYLCGEIGDGGEDGAVYLREGFFSSYTAVEFYDDERDRSFVLGGVYDVHSPGDIVTRFFRYYGTLPENHFIVNQIPMSVEQLREYLKAGGMKETRVFESGRSYRQEVYAMLGGLRPKFRELLKKSVSFSLEGMDIQRFITEFVCDSEQTVNVAPMQANIRSYKNLERTAAELEKKKAALQKIASTYEDYRKNVENKRLYSYLIDRALVETTEEKLTSLREKEKALAQKVLNEEENLTQETESYQVLQDQCAELELQLRQDQTEIRLKEIAREIEGCTARITRANSAFDSTLARIGSVRSRFYQAKNETFSRADTVIDKVPDGFIAAQLESLQTEMEHLTALFDPPEELSPEQVAGSKESFEQIIARMESLKEIATLLHAKVQDAIAAADAELRRLNAERQELEKGRFQFPQNALDLKQAILSRIRAETGESAEVALVAEAAEIKSDRWRNTIEGYLNTQRFYVIVPPRYVRLAFRVLDRLKREKELYDTGIVDMEKIMAKNPRAEENSLARELTTENPYVRAFLDHILGRVIKCDSVDAIREHSVSVTDDGLVYKNYVLRAMHPKLWRHPAIGQSAITRRLEEIRSETARQTEALTVYASLKVCAEKDKALSCFSVSDAERYIETAEDVIAAADDERRIAALEKERDSIDTANVLLLRQQLADKKAEKDEAYRTCGEMRESLGKVKNQLDTLREETIPKKESELREKQSALTDDYDEAWVADAGEPRYLVELSRRDSAEHIFEAFPRELSRARNAIERYRDTLVTERADYNTRFKTGFDVKAEDNEVYEKELCNIEENALPDYLSRIEDTKQKAMEEFQEDFLSKLSDNIRSVKARIDELNLAISSASFGEDTYRFKVTPKKDYERYYRMIMDEMLMGGYTLMSNQFNEKYREEIGELFAMMTGEGNASFDQSTYEKNVKLYTDYRTYLEFDIIVRNPSGEEQRLSRTLHKKSGGETQTPFYIAILASFAQLYRIGRDKKSNTARLIIFDEAFSKMDSERIGKSIQLLRKLGFQAILVTPTEKTGDIAPLADRTLVVLRNGRDSRVTRFDKERNGELIYV